MLSDDAILALIQNDTEPLTEFPGLTEEAAIVAQSKDPVDYTELDWHVFNPPSRQGKPDSQCELGSCQRKTTHYCELLSGTLFFGCAKHVNALIKMRVASKKRKFDSRV